MKKVLIILISILILVGCSKKVSLEDYRYMNEVLEYEAGLDIYLSINIELYKKNKDIEKVLNIEMERHLL